MSLATFTSSVNASPPHLSQGGTTGAESSCWLFHKVLVPSRGPRLFGTVTFLWLQHHSSKEKQEARSQEVAGPVKGQCSPADRGAWLGSIKWLQGSGVCPRPLGDVGLGLPGIAAL